VGHSTHSLDELVTLLRPNGISLVADVRSIPRSRRHPHFTAEALASALPLVGIAYRHCPGLGGLRKPRKDSTNTAWQHEGFRGFADYMSAAAFQEALEELVETAQMAGPIAIMCAEALWWRCHRQLIADALVARGITVQHITSGGRTQLHTLTAFARVQGDRVTYPGLLQPGC
jgi:uncharacterized protein (DUF488 family)